MQMEIENYKYTESRGFVLRTYRLEDAGIYICRAVANPTEQQLHFQMDVMESCELKLLMSGTNKKCKLGIARRLPPPLSTTSMTRGQDSSSPRFESSNDLPEAPPSVVHRSLSQTTNARTSRTSRSSNSILNLSGELSSTTMTTTTEMTEFTEQYTTEHGGEGFDRTTDASGGSGGSRNRLSSSGVGSRMLGSSAGQVTTGKGSRLDPSASSSVSRPFSRREL